MHDIEKNIKKHIICVIILKPIHSLLHSRAKNQYEFRTFSKLKININKNKRSVRAENVKSMFGSFCLSIFYAKYLHDIFILIIP